MLDEQQLPIWAQHTRDLAERAFRSSTVQRTSVETTVSTDASAKGRRSAGASTIRARCACRCRRAASLRRIAGSGSVRTSRSDPVGIVRDVQPRPAADLDDAPPGAARERTPLAAHACDLAQPEKRVIHQGKNPRPRRGRKAGLDFVVCYLGHSANIGAIAWCPHRSMRPSSADGLFRLSHRSPRRAASATAAVRELRPSLRRMFATWRCTVCGLSASSSAISRSLRPRATQARISRSRLDTRPDAGSVALCGDACTGTSASRHARTTSRRHRAKESARFPVVG